MSLEHEDPGSPSTPNTEPSRILTKDMTVPCDIAGRDTPDLPESRIKLLIVIGGLGAGGAEHLLCDLVERLDRRVFDMRVCSLWPVFDLLQRLDEAKVPIIRIHKRSKYDWSIILRLRKYIREEHIDIVHTWMPTANVWGRLAAISANAPVIMTAEHLVWGNKPILLRLFEVLALTTTHSVIAVSKEVQETYRKAVRHSSHKCKLILNGVDLNRFDLEKIKSLCKESTNQLQGHGKYFLIGTVANLRPQKNYGNLLRAAKLVVTEYPHARFLIIGDGPSRSEVEQTILQLGLENYVTLTGYIEKPDHLIASLDLFVLSSDAEGLSLAMLEAMALQKPVVVTDVGGAREVLGLGEVGVLVPPKSPEALANAMKSVISDRSLQLQMGRRARVLVAEKFSLDAMVAGYESVYKEAVCKSRTQRKPIQLQQ